MQFRRLTVEAKDKFSSELDYEQGIASAVHRGIYYGLGGEMEFHLPELFDLVSEAVEKVVNAKSKYDRKNDGNGIQDYVVELEKSFRIRRDRDVIESISFGFEKVEDVWNLVITNFQTGQGEVTQDAGELDNDVAKRIILSIVRLYDRTGNMSKYEEHINKAIDRDFEVLFEGEQ